MTTLLNLFYSIPALIGAFCIAITLIVIYAPWNLIARGIMWTLIVMVMFCWFWSAELLKRFKAWMKKPEKWYDDLPDLFI